MKRRRVSGAGSSDSDYPSSPHAPKRARLRPEEDPEEEDGDTSDIDTSQSLDRLVSPIQSQAEGAAIFKSEKVVVSGNFKILVVWARVSGCKSD